MQNEYEMIPVYNFKDNNIIIKKTNAVIILQAFIRMKLTKKNYIIKLNNKAILKIIINLKI